MKNFATRLNDFIAHYIHQDQVGFVLHRQVSDQIRRAIDLIFILRLSWDGGAATEGTFAFSGYQESV